MEGDFSTQKYYGFSMMHWVRTVHQCGIRHPNNRGFFLAREN